MPLCPPPCLLHPTAHPLACPQIKQHAAELVQGLTGSPEGIAKLAGRSAKLLPPLFRLVAAPEATSRAALVALVNLSQVCGVHPVKRFPYFHCVGFHQTPAPNCPTHLKLRRCSPCTMQAGRLLPACIRRSPPHPSDPQEPAVQQQLLALNAVGRCMDYVREKSCPGRNDLLVMLLANLTSLEAGAEALLQVGARAVRRREGRRHLAGLCCYHPTWRACCRGEGHGCRGSGGRSMFSLVCACAGSLPCCMRLVAVRSGCASRVPVAPAHCRPIVLLGYCLARRLAREHWRA